VKSLGGAPGCVHCSITVLWHVIRTNSYILNI
jgi:hypothetical protein